MMRHAFVALLLGLLAMAPRMQDRPRESMSSAQIKATRELKDKLRDWQRTKKGTKARKDATAELIAAVGKWELTLPPPPRVVRVKPPVKPVPRPVKRTKRTHGADGKVATSKRRIVDDQNARTMNFRSIRPSTKFEATDLVGPPPPPRMERHGEILLLWSKFRMEPIVCCGQIDGRYGLKQVAEWIETKSQW